MALTVVDQGLLGTYAQYTGFKNRIINGDMRIDQRNNGSSGTANTYTVDRWAYTANLTTKGTWQQNAGAVTPPSSFSNYLGFTSNSSYSVAATDYFLFRQPIEGFNFADFSWGTANARAATASFWVRSSLTGTFAVNFSNTAGTRTYPATYTISAANTWEQKTVTVAGDVTGTWVGSTNGVGLYLDFAMGVGSTYSGTANTWNAGLFLSATGATSVVGTSGATFYITGVQLEAGSTATSFDRRDIGREMMMCQRYYYQAAPLRGIGVGGASSVSRVKAALPVTMRAAPTLLTKIGTPSLFNGSVVSALSSITSNYSSADCIEFDGTITVSMTAGTCVSFYNANDGATVAASAEL